MPAFDYHRANDESRAEIAELVSGLRPGDLGRQIDGGWTVAMLFGHLAFWDRSLELRWREALDRGLDEPEQVPDGLTDVLNGALASILEAVPASALVERVSGNAAAVDALIAGLPDRCVQAATAAGHVRLLDRSLHRREHLAQIRVGADADS